jgi:hypothetical protein
MQKVRYYLVKDVFDAQQNINEEIDNGWKVVSITPTIRNGTTEWLFVVYERKNK